MENTYTNYMHIKSSAWSLWHVSTLTRWHYKGSFNKVPTLQNRFCVFLVAFFFVSI